jgi:hypothetical protein
MAFVVHEEVPHRNSDLRHAFKLHMDSFTRVAARTTTIFADAIFAGGLKSHLLPARITADCTGFA